MNKKSFAALGLLTLAVSAPAYAADSRSPSSTAVSSVRPDRASVPSGVSLGSRSDEAKYAAREAAAPDAKKYRGGDVIVISATALVIILLIVVIIILL
jgi:hypothetical protein